MTDTKLVLYKRQNNTLDNTLYPAYCLPTTMNEQLLHFFVQSKQIEFERLFEHILECGNMDLVKSFLHYNLVHYKEIARGAARFGDEQVVAHVLNNWDTYIEREPRARYELLQNVVATVLETALQYQHHHIVAYLFEREPFLTYYNETKIGNLYGTTVYNKDVRPDAEPYYIKPNADTAIRHCLSWEMFQYLSSKGKEATNWEMGITIASEIGDLNMLKHCISMYEKISVHHTILQPILQKPLQTTPQTTPQTLSDSQHTEQVFSYALSSPQKLFNSALCSAITKSSLDVVKHLATYNYDLTDAIQSILDDDEDISLDIIYFLIQLINNDKNRLTLQLRDNGCGVACAPLMNYGISHEIVRTAEPWWYNKLITQHQQKIARLEVIFNCNRNTSVGTRELMILPKDICHLLGQFIEYDRYTCSEFYW